MNSQLTFTLYILSKIHFYFMETKSNRNNDCENYANVIMFIHLADALMITSCVLFLVFISIITPKTKTKKVMLGC